MPIYLTTQEKRAAIEKALTVRSRLALQQDFDMQKMLPVSKNFPDDWIGKLTFPDTDLLQKIKQTPPENREGPWKGDLALGQVEHIVAQLQVISSQEGPQESMQKQLVELHFEKKSHDNPTEAMKSLTNPSLLYAAWGVILFPDSWSSFPNDKSNFEALLGDLYRAQVIVPFQAQNKRVPANFSSAESLITLRLPEETIEGVKPIVCGVEAYSPISDFAILETHTDNQRTITLWGEFDSDNDRYDYRKGQAVAFCHTSLWKAIHDQCPRFTASLWASRTNTVEALRFDVFNYPSQRAEIERFELTLTNGASCALHFLRIVTSLLNKQQKQPTLSLSREIATLKDYLKSMGVKSKNTKSKNSSNANKHPRDDDRGSGGTGSGPGGRGDQADSRHKRQRKDTKDGNSEDDGGGFAGGTTGGSSGGSTGGSMCAALGDFFSDPATWTPPTKSTSAPQLNRGRYDRLSDPRSSQTAQTMTFSLVLDDPPAQWMTAAGMIVDESDEGGPCALIRTPSHDTPVAAAKLVKKREVEILEILKHIRGVVKAIAALYFRADLWLLVTEYSGKRLTDYVLSSASFSSPPLLPVLEQILDTIQEIHEAGYVHLDIKHDNIVVQASPHGNVATVLDFGHARSILAGVPDTLYGTEGWLAPEVESGSVASLTDLDTFSLGKVLLFVGENYTGVDVSETQRNAIPFVPSIFMVYFLRSRLASSSSIAAQQAPVFPLFSAASHSFDLSSHATFLEFRLVEKSNREKQAPSVEDVFGDGEELTDLSDSDGEDEPYRSPSPLPPRPTDLSSAASSTSPAPPPLVGTKRSAEDGCQSSRNKRRKRARKAAKAAAEPATGPSERTIQEALLPSKNPQQVTLQAQEFDAAYGAHTGKIGKDKAGRKGKTGRKGKVGRGKVAEENAGDEKLKEQAEREAEYDVDDLVKGRGFDHIKWDGIKPIPIIDANDIVVSVLAGRPNREDYLQETRRAHSAVMLEGNQAGLTGKCEKRGNFPAHTKGITMGMGSRTPVLLAPDNQWKGMGGVLQRLVDLVAFKRISGYQNAAFELWAPRLYERYRITANAVRRHRRTSRLPWNFGDSNVFAAAAFNFGGKVRTFKHRDHLNWAFGWCAITALGKFDAGRSARLVLWEFKLVVDFPPGSTVLIPSAVVTHSNTRIAEGDERTSFTQYTAGAIFRWVGNGCKTEDELESSNPQAWSEMMNCKRSAVSDRIKLYSTIDELLVHTG
ncbi:hypothetical protein V5O48_006552 [Marasmius crinis-equi]|uniref:Protein kinase domain-containing protein n=1 Tax=Marasmius crinis-equi TaxID=585013 RepID=A0ABR3FJC8_9AGAR